MNGRDDVVEREGPYDIKEMVGNLDISGEGVENKLGMSINTCQNMFNRGGERGYNGAARIGDGFSSDPTTNSFVKNLHCQLLPNCHQHLPPCSSPHHFERIPPLQLYPL